MRANFYIDGFNVYYGIRRWQGSRWLDLGALCTRLFPNDLWGVSLIWKGAGGILDRRYLVVFVVRVAVAGALAGALASP
jgi:hypothetical protein